MRNPIFAMDTYFSNSIVGVYPYQIRCEMLAELGYDAIYVSLSPAEMRNAAEMAVTKERYGLDVTAAMGGLDIASKRDGAKVHQVSTLFEQLPSGCDVELSLSSSDQSVEPSSPAADGRALELLGPLLDIAECHDANVCLYPHFGAWLERVEDGVRLCRKMNHPRLKVVFCGFHWYLVDGKNLPRCIREASPYLRSVNMCGTRRPGPVGGCTIEPLDNGEMDNFALLALLHENGYTGRIGFQGYGMGGDVYAYLRRSLTAFRSMEDRLERHPDWGRLNWA